MGEEQFWVAVRVCEADLGGAAEGRGRTTWGVEGHHNQEGGSGLSPPDLECWPEH